MRKRRLRQTKPAETVSRSDGYASQESLNGAAAETRPLLLLMTARGILLCASLRSVGGRPIRLQNL